MAESRDDFIIAIRSAFLNKSTKQKFSLLTLVFFSIVIIVLSSFNFKAITVTKTVIKEIVYRSSFIVSIVFISLGVVGDLFMSKIKRLIDVKDSGTIFPGHGGLLDRIDSYLISFPYLLIVLHFFYLNL